MDTSVTFSSLGGLDEAITKVREVVMLPLMYKEYYIRRGLSPAKGILFHGPPGTGKTMLGRALANECSSIGGLKVSFLYHKGADLMSKWVGESEKRIRNLFEEASAMQPSIIFFDEIDGLAPGRSVKTDQVYSSVVSTLLAEIDGLKDRGDVIVIGATNRIDAVDSALRRPGRFDFEVPFMLPDKLARSAILQTYVSKWNEKVDENILNVLSEKTVGFSGADLQLLCAEASLSALRRRYPQIYSSTQKYLLDYESVRVEELDWSQALSKVKSTFSRAPDSIHAAGSPLPGALEALFSSEVQSIVDKVKELFPYDNDLTVLHEPAPKRFLVLSKKEDSGLDQYIIPAVLHRLEKLPVFELHLGFISPSNPASEVAAITRVFSEASRANKAAIVVLPFINYLFQKITSQGKHALCHNMASVSTAPVLVLAYCETRSCGDEDEDYSWSEIQSLFSDKIYEVRRPGRTARTALYSGVLCTDALLVRLSVLKEPEILEELPLAHPTPPPKPSEADLKKMQKEDEYVLRILRQYLRTVIGKLARIKSFRGFLRPIDGEMDIPDDGRIVINPMYLEKMMYKLDQGQYLCSQDFLQDLYLIRNNAVNFYIANNDLGADRLASANQLVLRTKQIFEGGLDPNLDADCNEIASGRRNAVKERSAEFVTVNCSVSAFESESIGPISSETGSRRRRARRVTAGDYSSMYKTELIGDERYELVPSRDIETLTEKMEYLAQGLGKYTKKLGISELLDLRYQMILAVQQEYFSVEKILLVHKLEGVIANFFESHLPNKKAAFDAYMSLNKGM